MINTTRPTPISMAAVRLSIDCSMNVAGRKIVVSTAMPGSPGAISAMACSTPRVTSMVLAPRNFCTTSKQTLAVVDHGVTDQRAGVDRARCPGRPAAAILPSRSSTGTCAELLRIR